MCTKNHNHMMYNFWDTECDRQDFLSFWAIFSIFPTNNPSNQNFEKMKSHLEILLVNKLENQNFEKIKKTLEIYHFTLSQGFPNSGNGWGVNLFFLGGIRNFAGRGEGLFFCQVVRTWGALILVIWTFFKAKNCTLWIMNIN